MHPSELKSAFDRGENITELLRREKSVGANTEDIIETAYDLQTGSYVRGMEDPALYQHKIAYGKAISEILDELIGAGGNVLEPGVGEGTTMSFVVNSSQASERQFHGLDISWSRLCKCRQWMDSKGCCAASLCAASIFDMPYADDSFDAVYTSHTMEPNGGSEISILQELYRVAARYIVLLEPAYELAAPEAQQRMDRLGYVKGLKEHAIGLGMSVIRHDLFSESANPLNPTAVTIIEKTADAHQASPKFICPRFGDLLKDYPEAMYSPTSFRAYPKLLGIPCLRIEDGIIASQFENYV